MNSIKICDYSQYFVDNIIRACRIKELGLIWKRMWCFGRFCACVVNYCKIAACRVERYTDEKSGVRLRVLWNERPITMTAGRCSVQSDTMVRWPGLSRTCNAGEHTFGTEERISAIVKILNLLNCTSVIYCPITATIIGGPPGCHPECWPTKFDAKLRWPCLIDLAVSLCDTNTHAQ